MLGALGTTLCFALTVVFASRSALHLGPLRANAFRLFLAVCFLGTWAHLLGIGLGGVSFPWFFASGLAGFGIGGVAMFLSLPKLGSSLSTLIVQCCTVWVAAGGEWLWLGTRLTPWQLAFAALTLAGVALGLAPRSWPKLKRADWHAGIGWALLSALGQGMGAVLSRKAFMTARATTVVPDAATSAYQRALGGLLVACLVYGVTDWILRRNARCSGEPENGRMGLRGNLAVAWPWVLANVVTGPVLGVTSYQWALSHAPAGIVQPIVATAPLLTIPFALWIERVRPRRLYYWGALIAVLGVCGLYLATG